MSDKWKRWFDRWNPWALRREIKRRNYYYEATNERLSMAIKENIENKKRIETLESELRVKETECDKMRSEINAAIGLLQEVAEDKPKPVKLEDIKCDRCGNPARFDACGGNCEICGSNLCADCALWRETVDYRVICKRCSDAEDRQRGISH